MSVCISKHGEYSAHTPSEDDEFTCGFCFVLDEQAIRDRLATAERREREARTVGRGEVLLLLDNTEGLADAMNRADGAATGRVSPSWESLSPAGRAFYKVQADAVRAYLLSSNVDTDLVDNFCRLWLEVEADRGES